MPQEHLRRFEKREIKHSELARRGKIFLFFCMSRANHIEFTLCSKAGWFSHKHTKSMLQTEYAIYLQWKSQTQTFELMFKTIFVELHVRTCLNLLCFRVEKFQKPIS